MAKKKTVVPAYGRPPQIDLLPQDFKEAGRLRAVQSALVFGLIAVLVLAGAGVAGSMWYAAQANEKLEKEQARTLEILAEQEQYSVVPRTKAALSNIQAVREAALLYEVDGAAYRAMLQEMLAQLEVEIDVFGVRQQVARELFESTEEKLLLRPYLASIQFSLRSSSLVSEAAVVEMLKALPGYAYATFTGVNRGGDGIFTMQVSLYLNEGAQYDRDTESAQKLFDILQKHDEQIAQGIFPQPEAEPEAAAEGETETEEGQ